MTGGVEDMIRAYHGSPHDFDRFDLSKIGTGEGAQAYGHGLYFAENEGVAKGYRDKLSQNLKGLQPLSSASDDVRSRLAEIQERYGANNFTQAYKSISSRRDYHTNEAQTAFEKYVDNPKRAEREYNSNLNSAVKAEEDLRFLDENAHHLDAHKGRMYEVGIRANPEHFLDWERPLSEQHQKVQDLAKSINPRLDLSKVTGANFYDRIRPFGLENQHEAAAKLREAGIPGIKYLDQGSRGKGAGTRNFVVFDDKLIDILKKYGIAGIGALPAMNAYHYQDNQ
jgi:hypothetical protein